ncbi:hypothetical protein VIA_000144 [Vibrio orientalis CIP 102891 = ATCC 33934]|uniref:Uncharacterized protein n=1 Tax=Vibrio orientalis CIP 102891 = ATCC 33934 TaxID=675816 RepID=A0ABM9Z7D1_VIBOR|nr:hypothetical protein VIA_000144 [Vibrio orientalis CIP 102891 = ATCC 33934]
MLSGVEVFNWQSSGFRDLPKNSACWEIELLHLYHIKSLSLSTKAFFV